MGKPTEAAVVFSCCGETLLGIVTMPQVRSADADMAVLIIVGGPQYRAGSHRQFVHVARAVATEGYPVMRFDYRGMGDSTGPLHSFEQVTEDIGAAMDALCARLPGVRRVVLWGLCDGASAALLYLQQRIDTRVAGLCLVNPWTRSPATLARTHVKNYYLRRVMQPAFWTKLLSGQVARKAWRDLLENLRLAGQTPRTGDTSASSAYPYQDRMADAWRRFGGPILLVLSEVDFTAKEFIEYASTHVRWRGCLEMPSVLREQLPGADHTFTDLAAQRRVEQLTLALMGKLSSSSQVGTAIR